MQFEQRWPVRLAALLAGIVGVPSVAPAADQVDLTRGSAAARRQSVTVQLEMGGELKVDRPADQQAGDLAAADEPWPVSVTANLAYDELLLPGEVGRSVRLIRDIDAQTKMAGRSRTPTVRQSRRLLNVEIRPTHRHFLAASGPLRRNELDTLDLPADSLTLDGLLPGRPLELGDTWRHAPEAIQTLVGLDAVDLCEVSSVLAEANDRFARCQLAGAVHGVSQGAAVEMDLEAVYLVDLQLHRVSRLNLAIREKRKAGPATPALDGVAKLRVAVSAADDQSPLDQQAVARATRQATDETPTLELVNNRLGFSTRHTPNWHPTGERADELTLRRVGLAADELVAHGNLTRLDPKPLDPRRALGQFRSDVLQALGDGAQNLISDHQWTNQHGCRVMGVVVEGTVGEVPVEWHSYQVAPPTDQPDLHRLALTFTVEQSQREQLGDEDRSLVDQIRLLPAAEPTARRPQQQR